MPRGLAVVRMSCVRYHPFLLVNPPLEECSEVRWAFFPLGLVPSSRIPYCSRKAVSWSCRSSPARSSEAPLEGLTRQMIQSFSSVIIFFALSCSPGGSMPSQTITTGPLLSPQKIDGSLSSASCTDPSSVVWNVLVWNYPVASWGKPTQAYI